MSSRIWQGHTNISDFVISSLNVMIFTFVFNLSLKASHETNPPQFNLVKFT